MPLTGSQVGWVSASNPHDGPSSTLQNAGWAGGAKLPQRFLNWLLLICTEYFDNYLRPLQGTYSQVVLAANWHIANDWKRSASVFSSYNLSAHGGRSHIMPSSPSTSDLADIVSQFIDDAKSGLMATQPVWDYDTGAGNVFATPVPNGLFPRQNLAQGRGTLSPVSPLLAYPSQQLVLPFGARQLTSVEVRIKPAVVGRAGLPGAMPKVDVRIEDKDGSTVASFPQADTSANVAAYEAAHSITVTVNHAIDPTAHRVLVSVLGEDDGTAGGGPNFAAGLEVHAALVTYQMNLASHVINGSPL